MTFLGASTCLNIAEASRSIDLRFCLDGASVAYLRNSNADIIISGSPYYQFAKGSGFVNNNTGFNPVRRTDTTFLDDYSLMGSSSAISDSVYSPSADSKKTIVAVFGAPGVPQSGDKNGSGFVMLNVIEKASSQRLIMKSQLLHGSLFGSRFGHAVNFVDLNGDGWDDLLVGAPFERDQGENGILHQDIEGRGMHRIPSFGCVYVYWNQQQRLPSTGAFSDRNVQVIRAPTTLSPLSGFGSAITDLGDIDHDGINDFAVGAPYDESGGVVVVYHGSASKHIGPPTQLINASELPGSLQGLGFSLGLGGLDLDDNGYPDLAVGAPNSDKIAVFRTRPVIKGEALVVLEDGSTHFKGMLDSLEDCTWDTQIMPGYWAPKVHCMNVKVIMTFYNVDPISCQQRSIPAQLLLTIDPPENWLTEEFKKNASSQTPFPLGGGGAVASFFGERVLQVTDPEVRPFYQLAGDNVPLDHDQSLPFLLLPTQRAVCRSKSMLGQPPSQDELALATTVRLAFRVSQNTNCFHVAISTECCSIMYPLRIRLVSCVLRWF
ncbi:unnamed protein product [Mesocestoides corti]|uniref:Integrin alpha-2 domain-containing protein n=2 Tax=Mesocestoides corti TaxID=53468 RepID=A0A158QSY6_MESCO|nr:unnamed protein product [Mesocestoides corti]